jgi:Tol biopolymer transport system component
MPIDGTLASIKTFDAFMWSWALVRWSPDGKALLHNAQSNDRSNIWLQPIDGGPARELTHFADQTMINFNLTADGKQLIIARGLLSRDALLIKNFK